MLLGLAAIAGAQQISQAPTVPELRHGRELLQKNDFAAAKGVFAQYLSAHPADMQAELGLGDAELGLKEYEPAELTYRAVVAKQPELWQAHKNLVVVEAELGRWEEFDRERTVLRMARERRAPNISATESDLIDSFRVNGRLWVVRSYFVPIGRSQARYNFERFSPNGRAEEYISLEDAKAARAALTPGDVRIGTAPAPGASSSATSQPPVLALNWYTGAAHGTIREYTSGEPTYEHLRAEVLRWLRLHEKTSPGSDHP